MSRHTESALGYLLAVVIATLGYLVISHWMACEQYDAFCAFTGSDQ